MRAVYRNPRELATCIKDSVDLYLEDLITYEKLEDKITKIADANGERVYKDGKVQLKLANILGDERVDIINKILADK